MLVVFSWASIHRLKVTLCFVLILLLYQMKEEETKKKIVFGGTPPKPFLPSSPQFSFLDLNALEIARQMTLMEYDLYKSIKVSLQSASCVQCHRFC